MDLEKWFGRMIDTECAEYCSRNKSQKLDKTQNDAFDAALDEQFHKMVTKYNG